jgi:hypothetical protein
MKNGKTATVIGVLKANTEPMSIAEIQHETIRRFSGEISKDEIASLVFRLLKKGLVERYGKVGINGGSGFLLNHRKIESMIRRAQKSICHAQSKLRYAQSLAA